jgi:hypothetical protein
VFFVCFSGRVKALAVWRVLAAPECSSFVDVPGYFKCFFAKVEAGLSRSRARSAVVTAQPPLGFEGTNYIFKRIFFPMLARR